jgi:hypothetical protein
MAASIAAKTVSGAVVAKPTRASRVVAPKVNAALCKVSRPQRVQPAEVAMTQASSMMIWQPINNKVRAHRCSLSSDRANS